MKTQGWCSRLSWRQMSGTFSSCAQGSLIWQHQLFLTQAELDNHLLEDDPFMCADTQRAVQDPGLYPVLSCCRHFAVSSHIVSRTGTVGFAAGLDGLSSLFQPKWESFSLQLKDQQCRVSSLWVWIWEICTLLSLPSQSEPVIPMQRGSLTPRVCAPLLPGAASDSSLLSFASFMNSCGMI